MSVSQQDKNARNNRRINFDMKRQRVLMYPKNDELLDEGPIHYRWHYSDDPHVLGLDIEELPNRPSTRWFLYTTGLENPGEFFYSIHQQDLVVDPMAGTPRIGPYAPPIRTSADVTITDTVRVARLNNIATFEKRLKTAETKAKKKKEPFTGQIHCRWHFTDMKVPTVRQVKTCDSTQSIRDLFTEFQVKYPNQFWASWNAQDMVLTFIDGIERPQQGPLIPAGEGPSASASTASATVSSAAASTSTAGTGQTHRPPSPTGEPDTKKARTAPATTEPTIGLLGPSALASGSSAGTGPTHTAPAMPRSTPSSTVSVAPAVDTEGLLSSAANPIQPDSGIAGTSSEETVQAIDASQLTTQPIGSLTADADDAGGSLLTTNDPNFPLQFMNLPTSGTEKEQDKAEKQEEKDL